MPQSRRKRRRLGASAVEFALVAPIIVLFSFAFIESGRVLMSLNSLEGAAQEGCRAAIVDGSTSQEITSAVDSVLGTAGITGHTVTTTPADPSAAGEMEPVTVTVTVAFSDISWIPMPQHFGGIELSSTCTLPRESSGTSLSTN